MGRINFGLECWQSLARFGSQAAHEPARAGSLTNQAKILAWLGTIFQRAEPSSAINEPSLASHEFFVQL